MAYYLQINRSLPKATIETATNLDPGSIYQANDDKAFISFVNDDGTARQAGVTSDTGTSVEEAPVEIAASSIVSSTITAAVNNFNPTGFDTAIVVMITNNSGTLDWTGMVPAGDYRKFTLYNKGADDIRFKHLSASSTAGNRIFNRGGAVNYTLGQGESIDFLYDTSASQWIML